MLAATEVGEVWGVGRRIGQQLKDAGIQTVLDSRAQTYLTLTTSGSIATTPNITTAVFNGYFTKITTPSIADNSDPLTYEFTFMVVSITIT